MKALWSCLGLLVSILLGLFILVGVPMLFAGVLPLGQLPELIDRYVIQPVSGSIPSSLVEWGTTTSEIHPSAASVSKSDTYTNIQAYIRVEINAQSHIGNINCFIARSFG